MLDRLDSRGDRVNGDDIVVWDAMDRNGGNGDGSDRRGDATETGSREGLRDVRVDGGIEGVDVPRLGDATGDGIVVGIGEVSEPELGGFIGGEDDDRRIDVDSTTLDGSVVDVTIRNELVV